MQNAETLRSYSRLHETRPRGIDRPLDADGVAHAFRRAAREQRRVTVRAAGRSFDEQALGDDLVLDVSRLDHIGAVDVEAATITVGCGARWDRIVTETLAHGLVPHILVTTPGATAGGTVAGNCLSRSAPRYGHTGDHVRALTVVTPCGERLHCSREKHDDVFRAVIGGLGFFGVVTDITFDLLRIGRGHRVKSTIERVEGLSPFAARLATESLAPGQDDAVYSVFSLRSPQRGAIFRSRYTEESATKPLHIYRPYAWYRPFVELSFLSSRLSNAFCHASYALSFGRGPFVDDFHGYTFCMEANEVAKSRADALGLRMTSMQVTYVVPLAGLVTFLEDAACRFIDWDVYPSLLDCLYRPASDYLLCASRGLPGFCVSFMFEGLHARKLQRLRTCLLRVADACVVVGGRSYLVKNVVLAREHLRAMYGTAAREAALLKQRLDPEGVIRNAFFDRVLPQE